jgi:K+-transporting ATPase c subunit
MSIAMDAPCDPRLCPITLLVQNLEQKTDGACAQTVTEQYTEPKFYHPDTVYENNQDPPWEYALLECSATCTAHGTAAISTFVNRENTVRSQHPVTLDTTYHPDAVITVASIAIDITGTTARIHDAIADALQSAGKHTAAAAAWETVKTHYLAQVHGRNAWAWEAAVPPTGDLGSVTITVARK